MSSKTPGFVTMERDEWLAQVDEEVIEPGLPICDPHHHLWDHPGSRYLLDELLEDIGSGHNVVSTVFMECASMYRADGPEAMKPVGETEFVNGIAAMSASGGYGDSRACASIVGFADLNLGAAAGDVLDAHCLGYRPLLRHSPRRRLGRQRRRAQLAHCAKRRDARHGQVPRGLRRTRQARHDLRRLALPSANRRGD